MNYKEVKIGDYTKLRQGLAINRETKCYLSNEITGISLLRIADMQTKSKHVYIKETVPKRFLADKEDIIYTRTGKVGLVFKGFEGVVHNNCFTVNTIDKSILNQEYLYYALKERSFFIEANARACGAAQPDLPHDMFKNINIKLPDVHIQKKIADILAAYDDLIENNQKQIKLLEEAAQRLYKEWFVDLRFPGYENTKIVDGVPEGWKVKKIGDICDAVGGGTPSTKVPAYYVNGDIPWVTPTDITKSNSVVLLETEKKITKEGLQHSAAKMVPKNTILMTSRASVGFFGICEYEVCTNQGFISCIPVNENLQMYLLYNLLSRVEELRKKAGGSTYLEISKRTFKEMDIIIPKESLLYKFQEDTYKLFLLMRQKEKSISLLKEARDRLLPKLMNGEIDLQ